MLPNSMNPYVNVRALPALSEHSLTVLRPLLRSMAMWHRGRTKMEPLDPDLDFDDVEVEDTPEAKAPADNELQRILNEPYSFTPAASAMTPSEIKAAIAADRDPFSEAIDTSPDTGQFLPRPPVPALIMAARFAALLMSADIVKDMTAPRAFTMLTIPGDDEREAAWKDIDNVLRRMAALCDKSDDPWRGFATPCLHGTGRGTRRFNKSEQAEFDASISTAVSKGCKLIVLAEGAQSMSPTTRAMCERTFDLPSLSAQMIIEILRVTHTNTGELSGDAIVEALPPDSDIAALPLAVIAGAFLEETTLKVAKALATAVVRFRALPSTTTTLNDIVLNESVRAPVSRLVADIASWKTGQLPWKEVSSSILFHGPPGNGKTLLASALAGSLQVPLVSTSYSDCQKHGHQGDMLKALSHKVDEAIRSAPSVFFLDELDGFTHRNRSGRNSDYVVGVVNSLLEHLSRLNDTPGVIILGATNYPDMIDPAVVRPGRFDLKLELSNPERSSILEILDLELGNDAKGASKAPIADQLLGSSGAQVTALVREARGLARVEQRPLNQSHLEAVAARVCPALPPNVLWRIAIHEAGHLVAAHVLGLPRAACATMTGTGGFVDVPTPQLESAQSAQNRMTALLGGRAAEQVILTEALNGAGLGDNSDLELATKLAAQFHFQWGFGKQLTYQTLNDGWLDSNKAKQVEPSMRKALKKAIQIIEENQELVIKIANALLAERELSAAQIRSLFDHDNPINLTVSSD